MRKTRMILGSALLALAALSPAVQAEEKRSYANSRAVGVIEYSRGLTSLQGVSRGNAIAGKGTKFAKKDVITTGKKSFAILKLTDGTRLTLRPNSQFSVEEFNPNLGKSASATLNLFRGGMRTVTGFISKYNRNGYKMRTPVATIGIRGTEFDARLCGDDCKKESKKLKKVSRIKPKVIGRLAFIRGQVAAKNRDGRERILLKGSPLYEGDMLLTGRKSFAVMAFKDKSRVTLQPKSQFMIQHFRYGEGSPETHRANFGLLRGGLRAVSGLIGKVKKDAYRMRTPVATIGIRGTGYDLMCEGRCYSDDLAWLTEEQPTILSEVRDYIFSPANAQPGADGMYLGVWDGGIDVEQQGLTTPLDTGQFGFASNSTDPMSVLDSTQVPQFMLDNPAPRPDQVEVNDEQLFTQHTQEQIDSGLYVSVYEGHVTMQADGSGDTVEIGAGESAATFDSTTAVLLDETPTIFDRDWVPSPADVPNTDVLDQNSGDNTQQCTLI